MVDYSEHSCSLALQRKFIDIEYRGEGNHWQAQKLVQQTLDVDQRAFAMHAYYDDRPILEGKVYIRLFIVVADSNTRMTHISSYCQLWTDCSSVPILSTATVTNINGRRLVFAKGKYFSNFILSCRVPLKIVEKNIKVTKASFVPGKCMNSTVLIPVSYPVKPTKFEHVFGMCESNGVSFGYFGPEQAPWLIEWFEANMMFGITEFNIYNSTMVASQPVKEVLNYYKDRGVLLLHQQPPPISNYLETDRSISDIAMRTALNDCMYRNMYRYKYSVTIDLDELIVPNRFDNYSATIRLLEEKNVDNVTKSYTMTAVGFYMQFIEGVDEKMDSEFPLRSSQYMNAVGNPGRMKTFFNPRNCLGAFSHYCLRGFSGRNGQKVGPVEMMVHHYRNSCIKFPDPSDSGPAACKKKEQQKRYIGRMLDFQESLYQKLVHVSNLLNITVQR